ncbi:DnaD domain protein [Clostridium aciditolerans]|uniref:DnaD domain protein n=1 Tax=Clostridium aciditolerans TaxID=339861 RepID=A0A934HZ72_9CLOT|nr:DnaD domain protein [Clostridium aciditolerans]MBI6873443.1 DnaD domain protein [Clostridium aciditolerans]
MAVYRQVQTNFWQDDFILELTPEERYFYIYVMTNPRTTQCGIFKIVKKLIEVELGFDRKTVDKLLKRFMDYGKISYCERTNEIMIINWVKYNFIDSKNTKLCINKELKEVKNKEFIRTIYKICLERKYDIEFIFKDIDLDPINNEGEAKVIPLKTDSEDIKSRSASSRLENSTKEDNKGLLDSFEAPYKPLGEEEIYINKSYNKQKVMNKSISRVLLEFSKNIKKASKAEIEKFIQWRKDFEEEVIIKAIEQAVKYKAKHIGYIESIIKSWAAEGITTMKELMKKFDRTKPRVNFDAYRYVD